MDYNLLMKLVSQMGTRLAMAGAETYRVEETVRRILQCYGIEGRVYSVPNSLFISILEEDGTPITLLSRIEDRATDLDAVERFTNLSRKICREQPPLEQALEWVSQTTASQPHFSFPILLLAHAIIGFGFTFFYGGSITDSLCGGVCAVLLGIVTRFLSILKTNSFFQIIAASFLATLCGYGFGALGIPNDVHSVVMGPMMLLVPGLLFTNALRDIIFGDTNSGINRIIEVFLSAAAIGLGTGAGWNIAITLWGEPIWGTPTLHSALEECIIMVPACYAFGVLFNIHGWGSWLCAAGSGMTWAIYCLALTLGFSPLSACFLAVFSATVYSEIMARVRKYPAICYLVISILPLIPGSGVYQTAQAAFQGDAQGFVTYGTNTLCIAGVMAVGILMVVTTVRAWGSWKQTFGFLAGKKLSK